MITFLLRKQRCKQRHRRERRTACQRKLRLARVSTTEQCWSNLNNSCKLERWCSRRPGRRKDADHQRYCCGMGDANGRQPNPFTIEMVYEAQPCRLYHFDLYRLRLDPRPAKTLACVRGLMVNYVVEQFARANWRRALDIMFPGYLRKSWDRDAGTRVNSLSAGNIMERIIQSFMVLILKKGKSFETNTKAEFQRLCLSKRKLP